MGKGGGGKFANYPVKKDSAAPKHNGAVRRMSVPEISMAAGLAARCAARNLLLHAARHQAGHLHFFLVGDADRNRAFRFIRNLLQAHHFVGMGLLDRHAFVAADLDLLLFHHLLAGRHLDLDGTVFANPLPAGFWNADANFARHPNLFHLVFGAIGFGAAALAVAAPFHQSLDERLAALDQPTFVVALVDPLLDHDGDRLASDARLHDRPFFANRNVAAYVARDGPHFLDQFVGGVRASACFRDKLAAVGGILFLLVHRLIDGPFAFVLFRYPLHTGNRTGCVVAAKRCNAGGQDKPRQENNRRAPEHAFSFR